MEDRGRGEKQFIPPFSFLHRRFRRKRTRGYFVEEMGRKRERSERKGRKLICLELELDLGLKRTVEKTDGSCMHLYTDRLQDQDLRWRNSGEVVRNCGGMHRWRREEKRREKGNVRETKRSDEYHVMLDENR